MSGPTLGGGGSVQQNAPTGSNNLTINDTLRIANQAQQVLGAQTAKGLLDGMDQYADNIAYELNDTVSAADIKLAAQNIRDTAAQIGGDGLDGIQLLTVLQQNNFGAANLSEMNGTGTTRSLGALQQRSESSFNRVLGARYPSVAEVKAAADEGLARSMPDNRPPLSGSSRTYERGTIGSAVQRGGQILNGGNNGEGGGIRGFLGETGERALWGAGLAKVADALGGGENAQRNAGIIGAVFGRDIRQGVQSGQGVVQSVGNMDLTETLTKGALTYLAVRNRDLDAGTAVIGGITSGRGGDIAHNIGQRILGGLFGGNSGSVLRTPDFNPNAGGNVRNIFNPASGFEINGRPNGPFDMVEFNRGAAYGMAIGRMQQQQQIYDVLGR